MDGTISSALPVVETDEPLRGYKYADVRGADAPRIFPSGKYWKRTYEHRDTAAAVCHRKGHAAPSLDCECGFHAVPQLHDLPAVTEHHGRSVVLEVELGGTVVEHERGLRGEYQTVLGLYFPASCERCSAPATHLRRGRVWSSVCGTCAAARPHRTVSRADATALFGVEVGFVDAHRTRHFKRTVHRLRAAAMIVLIAVAAVYARRVPSAWWLLGGLAVLGAVTTALTAVTFATRFPRTRDSLFQAQCLCLAAASMLLIAATP